MSISIFKFDVGQMVCGREGEYVRRDDHERELAAKDAEIASLKAQLERLAGDLNHAMTGATLASRAAKEQ